MPPIAIPKQSEHKNQTTKKSKMVMRSPFQSGKSVGGIIRQKGPLVNPFSGRRIPPAGPFPQSLSRETQGYEGEELEAETKKKEVKQVA
jgi:hypothetical protein